MPDISACSSILSAKGIVKEFPGVKALQCVDFDLLPGELHFLLGENGAGKSTLINIFSGIHKPDSGQIFFEGKEVFLDSPQKAQKIGIRTIHQEFLLMSNLSVAENIMYGSDSLPIFYSKKNTEEKALQILDSLKVTIDPSKKIEKLQPSEKQIVDIARSLAGNVRVLIMDEPTSALSSAEISRLFGIIRSLKAKGVAIIYISHRLEELNEIADRLTILRDGQNVETMCINDDADLNLIVEKMVGRKLDKHYPYTYCTPGETVLEAKNLAVHPELEHGTISLRGGEILGVTGVIGAGMEPLAYSLAGFLQPEKGQILLHKKGIVFSSPADAMKNGIGLIPADRRVMGLILNFTICKNATLTCLSKVGRSGVVSCRDEADLVDSLMGKLGIVAPDREAVVRNLSGGNQQKVVIAKWLARDVDILICVEPTRGIDVGARVDIYNLFNQMAQAGKSVIIFSTDYSEILVMCSRIYAMKNGSVVKEFTRDTVNRESLLRTIFGATDEAN